MRYTITQPLEWLKFKTVIIPSVDKNVQQQKLIPF